MCAGLTGPSVNAVLAMSRSISNELSHAESAHRSCNTVLFSMVASFIHPPIINYNTSKLVITLQVVFTLQSVIKTTYSLSVCVRSFSSTNPGNTCCPMCVVMWASSRPFCNNLWSALGLDHEHLSLLSCNRRPYPGYHA